ncbi:MAG TPA: peptidoglycan-associated lipoprotein Pal [Candidatus Acidoferrum sp.]|jgi:peptidoglycan-associated lipoprotein
MIQPYRPYFRSLLISACALSLIVAGCNKKPPKTQPSTYTPPPAAVKPTVSLSADKTTINPGESAKLTWTSTDANNISIAPEVGAVTAQGTTTVTPAKSTTYTITASGPGGNADATVSITVNAAAPVTEPKTSSIDELFLQEVADAYFDYDSAELRPDARQAIQKDAAFFKQYPTMRVTIEGHCDERGSTEYNLALGQRRANAVMQYLVSLGIPESRLNATSWGKEKPFCMEATEACYAKNRRGHFVQAK